MTRPVVDAAVRAALDAVADGVAVFDRDWTISYVNPAGAAVLDRSVGDLLGVNMWTAFPEAVGTEFQTNLLAAAAGAPGSEPVSWSAYYGPVHGWFSDRAWRIGELVVVVYSRADEPRAAEATRQRLTAEVRDALARSQALLAASRKFNTATTVADVGEAAGALLAGGTPAPVFGDLALLGPDGRDLLPVRPDTLPEELRRYRRMSVDDDLPGPECVRTGRSVFLPDLGAVAERYPHLRESWAAGNREALACLPVQGPDGPLGTLMFAWVRPHTFDVGEQALMTTLAGYAGQAVSRIRAQEQRIIAAQTRYQDTRDAMLAMQRTLLAELPVLPRVRIEAHYLPADDDHAAGGDWFDAIPLDGGRVALVVGDVVGHGAVAAATMGRLRTVAAHLLAEDNDLPTVSRALDRFTSRALSARGATVCLAVLDTGTGDLEWITRGHPPPLVVAPGRARFLTGDAAADDGPGAASGVPLGPTARPAAVRTARLGHGETLMLYTDGLVESRARDIGAGLVRLRDAAVGGDQGTGPHEPSPLIARALEQLGRTGFSDDVTVLAVQRTAPPAPLGLVLDARPESLRQLRRGLASWLDQFDLDPDEVDNMLMATSEAVTNSIDHAYRSGGDAEPDGPPGSVTVDGHLDARGTLTVTVIDRGRWRPPTHSPGSRGRGMQLMQMLIESVTVEHGEADGGTCVRLAQRLARPAVFGSAPRPAGPRTATAFGVAIERGARATVRVEGSVDIATVQELRTQILNAGRGGTVPVTVDLDGVDQLASAGVALLFDLRERLSLNLHARPGSPAARVLALTGLDGLLVEADPETERAPVGG